MRARFDTAITLRGAKPSDSPFLRELAARAFGEYAPHAARTIEQLMRKHGARTILAERAERPLGFVIVRPEASAALAVDALAVLESVRGRGVGRPLMRAAEQRARASGFPQLALTTAQANVAARSSFLAGRPGYGAPAGAPTSAAGQPPLTKSRAWT